MLSESASVYALLDGAAGGSLRALIVPKAHIADYFDLPEKLRTACWLMVDRVHWLLAARSGRGTKRNAKAQRGRGAKGHEVLCDLVAWCEAPVCGERENASLTRRHKGTKGRGNLGQCLGNRRRCWPLC